MARFIDLTGEKFGKLTVIELAEDHITESGNHVKQWLCKCSCGNEAVIRGSYLRMGKVKSCGCDGGWVRMTQEEQKYLDDIYKYVKKDVMGYDDNQSLSKDMKKNIRNMVLRVKGIMKNKYIANNSVENTANYSYKVLYNTFKYCSMDIQNALRSVSFKDENHKLNYVLRIVENNLNNVYMRMKKMERSKEEAEKYDISEIVNYTATFRPKETKVNDRLKHLW